MEKDKVDVKTGVFEDENEEQMFFCRRMSVRQYLKQIFNTF